MELSIQSLTRIGGSRILLKRLTSLAVIFLALLTISSCGGGDSDSEPAPITVSSVQIRPSSATLNVDETITLTAYVYPETASDKSVSWYSSNSRVATVTNGKVTAISEGTATITAYAGAVKAECIITVTPSTATSIALSQTSVELTIGESTTITATVSPANASDKTITWSSSDTEVATVSDGTITAVATGTATITAQCGSVTAECVVTVSPVEATSIELSNTTVDLHIGETFGLTATVYPDDTTDKTIIWTSSNTSVATVSDGTITAVSVGTATITAVCGDVSAECVVTVNPIAVTSIQLSTRSSTISVGETVTLSATVLPSDATNKNVEWTSSNASIAGVNNGTVTAYQTGIAEITARIGDISDKCTITVLPTSISFSQNSFTVNVDDRINLTSYIRPTATPASTLSWTSSASDVVSVSNGIITAHKKGKSTITATCSNGATASCAITVIAKPDAGGSEGTGEVEW